MVKNYMEEVVEDLLPKLLETYNDICTCEKCLDDIRAIALNKLHPAYFVTRKGFLFTKMEETLVQSKADVIHELTSAIEIVSKNPMHN
ncbi:late competence development ComFB family protein [Eubacteriaceae bacterium ES2]|nr:late competence development ComFB family protein [Eubacteriaceae bacterium ES2]